MTKQLDKDMMRMMSLKDRMKYKADMDQMKRDIAKVKLEQSESKADVDGSHYSDMPSPEAYSQSNEALIARHKNKLSSEFQAKQQKNKDEALLNKLNQEPWVDSDDDEDDNASGGWGRDYGDEDDGGDN